MADNCPTNQPDFNNFAMPSDRAGETNVPAMVGYIKSRLGYPSVRIEVKDDVIQNHIQYSLLKFVSRAERPLKYWQFMTTRGKSIYNLPDDFVAMTDEPYYIPDSMVEFIQTFTAYQMYVNFTGNMDITMYETLMENLQLKINRIGATPTFEMLYNPPRIKIAPTPSQDNRAVVYCYVALPRLEDWGPQQDLIAYDWVLSHALAMTKETLGRIRGRYGNTIVAGDQSVTQDSAELLQESKEEIAKLEEELYYQQAPMPIISF
jgi:hypothetical protein